MNKPCLRLVHFKSLFRKPTDKHKRNQRVVQIELREALYRLQRRRRFSPQSGVFGEAAVRRGQFHQVASARVPHLREFPH